MMTCHREILFVDKIGSRPRGILCVEKIGSRPRGILCVDKIGSRPGGILVFAHSLLENRLMIDYQIGNEQHDDINVHFLFENQRIVIFPIVNVPIT